MAAGSAPQFASLYVGDLHPDVTEAILYEIFNSVGPVASIRICRDSVSRKSLGYGYVNFHAVGDAERALDTLNYSSIKGRACRIMWSQRDPSLRKSGLGNVFVKNLDRNIDNKALYDTFSLFGNILSCKVTTEVSGRSKGYGFVHYETEEAAKQAIERVNGMQIGEKTVQVTTFTKRNERPSAAFTNCYIKNFPHDWDDEKINSLFGEFGKLSSTAIMEDNIGRRFAFVNFEDPAAAAEAVKQLNKKDVRSEEDKVKDKESGREDAQVGPDGHPDYLLFVTRALTKEERAREFKNKVVHSSGAESKVNVGVNLYVKNLDEDADDDALKALFAPFGTVTSCVAMKDEKGKCKGFGFVCYASPEEATKAVTEMHLKVVKGKPLYVGLAEKKEARQDRLRQRYQPGTGGGCMGMGAMGGPMMGGGKGCKGAKGAANAAGGKPGMQPMGGMMGSMMGGMGGMQPMGGMMPNMMGGPMGMMAGKPQGAMGGMMGPQAAMMGKTGMPMMGMGGKAPMMAMGGPQMMSMMGGKPGMMPGTMPGTMPGMMMGKGMPGMMPGMIRPMAPQQQVPAAQAPQPGAGAPLTAAALAAAPPAVQKQMIGEKLYPAICKHQPDLAGKITGMMLEMDNSELLMLLESDVQLKGKVDEAMRVLGQARPS